MLLLQLEIKIWSMQAAEIKRRQELEEGNTKLKKMFANMSLENHAMKERFAKKAGNGRKKGSVYKFWSH